MKFYKGLEAFHIPEINSSVRKKIFGIDAFPPENFEGHQII